MTLQCIHAAGNKYNDDPQEHDRPDNCKMRWRKDDDCTDVTSLPLQDAGGGCTTQRPVSVQLNIKLCAL